MITRECQLTLSPAKDSPTRCCYCHEDFSESETKDTSTTAHCPHFNRDAHTECMIDFGSDCHECQTKARNGNGVKIKSGPFSDWDGHCVVCQDITWRQSKFAGENVFVCNGPCYARECLRHMEIEENRQSDYMDSLSMKFIDLMLVLFITIGVVLILGLVIGTVTNAIKGV